MPGAYLAFQTAPDANLPDLEWKRQDMRLAAAKRDPEGRVSAAIFVPDEARLYLEEKLTEYGRERTGKGEPVNKARFAAIDRFSAARLESLWVDNRPLPAGLAVDWWECWCWLDRVQNLEVKAMALGLPVSDDRLRFPEREVVFVQATASAMARLVSSIDAVAELRRGRDTAAFFQGESRTDQDDWVAALHDFLQDIRGENAPSVCLLDTGVNRAHPLIEPLLAQEDLHTVQAAWGTDDSKGHGTELAGLVLYGDLITPIQSLMPIPMEISLESVKVLPPTPFPANAPESYGLITLQAVARPEIANPARARVFCLAIGQDSVSGPRASSWSAAIDQSAFGSDAAAVADRRRRLFVIAAGNIPDGLNKDDMEDWDSYEVEDPGQSWNALTVGGVTEKAEITEAGHDDWTCAVGVDDLSPYSRVSAAWNRNVAPIKPELVFEAGNRGVDPADSSLWSGLDSLSLLTTGHDVINAPLATAWATSAAAAQVAGMAARVHADNPSYWPETVRALLVHSARWTAPMQAAFDQTPQKGERLKMARRFGYGRPNLVRARQSTASSLALISQEALQPYRLVKGTAQMNALHVYQLPWPKSALAELAQHMVRLRITLSYFIDPNPSADAPLSPARYRSFGLRFDLRRKGESVAVFQRRLSELAEAPADDFNLAEVDNARLLGARAVSAGSLHSDEWRCTAADLIERDCVAIFPVGGWWKQSRSADIAHQTARYSLVITLDGGDTEVDLYAEIEQAIAAEVPQEVVVEV
ncbi:MAG: S8 family peptidase [Caulobacterales bacterium]